MSRLSELLQKVEKILPFVTPEVVDVRLYTHNKRRAKVEIPNFLKQADHNAVYMYLRSNEGEDTVAVFCTGVVVNQGQISPSALRYMDTVIKAIKQKHPEIHYVTKRDIHIIYSPVQMSLLF